VSELRRDKKEDTSRDSRLEETESKEAPIPPQPSAAAGRGIHAAQKDDAVDLEGQEDVKRVRGIADGVQEKGKAAESDARRNRVIGDIVDVSSRKGKGESESAVQKIKAVDGTDKRDDKGKAKGRVETVPAIQKIKTVNRTDKLNVKRPSYFQFTADRAEKTDNIEMRIAMWEAYVENEVDSVNVLKGMLNLSELYMVRAFGDTSRMEMEKAVEYYQNTKGKLDSSFVDSKLDAMEQTLIEQLIEKH